ncbi:MAG: isoprenylcysteine carboxylmethyltransferase family protein [Thermoplasmatota archaeon]
MIKDDDHEKIGMRLVLKSILIFLVFIIVTFLSSGRLDYWQGWVFNGLNIFFILATYVILNERKDLIRERLKPGVGMKRWDRVYYAISTPLFFIMFIISILDASRFFWKPMVPFFIVVLGIILYAIGQMMILWAKKANAFFSSVVRIQSDRNHTVCSEGPYRIVRHPGYLGGLIFTIATPLLLGSFYGLLPAVLTVILMFGRTYLEDNTLKEELPGYLEYSQKVRYRIIPFIW